ncbi:MAG TPA: peptidoglycan DD-metalloendopeptidase family protein [Methylococcaceae bacterium]|nr:peptidoglycan DD-metalloendopeptidase family protein [Methylococcaceae bacterium]
MTRVSLGLAVATLCFLGGCAAPKPPAVPTPPQAPQARPMQRIGGITYVVRRGDTLYSIAWRAEADFRNLARWNNLAPPYKILAGQSLRLVAPFEEERSVERPAPAVIPAPGGARVQPLSPSAPVSVVRTVSPPPMLRAPEPEIRPEPPPAWRWPLRGNLTRAFSQAGNKGIDIEGKSGDPVRAAAAGKIVYSGQGLIGYGNLVIVKHSDTFLSAYGNNTRLLVREGDEVASNQPIAEIGAASGLQQALHFEIRKMGKPVNPLDYLPKR